MMCQLTDVDVVNVVADVVANVFAADTVEETKTSNEAEKVAEIERRPRRAEKVADPPTDK
jgi:hypothetical protein